MISKARETAQENLTDVVGYEPCTKLDLPVHELQSDKLRNWKALACAGVCDCNRTVCASRSVHSTPPSVPLCPQTDTTTSSLPVQYQSSLQLIPQITIPVAVFNDKTDVLDYCSTEPYLHIL